MRTRRIITLYVQCPFFFKIKRKGVGRYSLTARSVEGATCLRIKNKYVGIFVSCYDCVLYIQMANQMFPHPVIRNIRMLRHRRQMCRCAVPFPIGRKREAPALSAIRMSRRSI